MLLDCALPCLLLPVLQTIIHRIDSGETTWR